MSVTIDCDTCVVRGDACSDCVVTVLLGFPERSEESLAFDADEAAALSALADNGLVPPLRMVYGVEGPQIASA